ncbi:hypothetical protein O9929_17075 [Vibrio lentus]|nr:hypothetical protein [Vibrio lentus]
MFGFDGTPVNKVDKNTFRVFGRGRSACGYMSRYTFHDSIRERSNATSHFEPRLVDVQCR